MCFGVNDHLSKPRVLFYRIIPLPVYHMGACVPAPLLSHVRLFVILWTVAHQAPQSMKLSRQEFWSGLPFPPQGDLPDSGIEPASLVSPALAGRLLATAPAGKPTWHMVVVQSLGHVRLCSPRGCSMPGVLSFTVSQRLPWTTQIKDLSKVRCIS